jgi:hypothetical protein
MTAAESISYLILALHQLGYSYEDIRRIRKEYEAQLMIHTEAEAGMEAAMLIAKLIKDGVHKVTLN